MSILINGMEMPKNGSFVCITIFGNGIVVRPEEIHLPGTPHDPPKLFEAISVPTPHGRLGDLDKLERMFADIDNAPYSGFDGEEPFYSADDAARIIRLTPTIIPAEEGKV